MIDDLIFPVTFVSALGCGLIAGVFFAFSTFVMKALAGIDKFKVPRSGRDEFLIRPRVSPGRSWASPRGPSRITDRGLK